MSLFSRRRRSGSSGADVAALEQEVTALREALDSCRAFGRRSKRALVVAAAVLGLMLGVVFVDRETVRTSVSGIISALGIAESARGADAAYAAYKSGDMEAALRLSRPLAEQGDARAQSLVGLVLRAGRGVPQDEIEAAKWFRRAAEQGDHVAQFQLGTMFSTGRGVPQDYSEGANWYRLAADGGNPQAQFNLGVMYFNGYGLPQSNINAHMWFNLAAAHYPASGARDRAEAVNVRDVVAMKMTREEISEAQKLARDWKRR